MTLSLLTSVSLFVSLFLLRSLLYHSACPGQGPPVMGPILPVLAAPSLSVCAAPILPVCAWARTLSACLCLGQDPSCLSMPGSGPILPVYAWVKTHPACRCLGQGPTLLPCARVIAHSYDNTRVLTPWTTVMRLCTNR